MKLFILISSVFVLIYTKPTPQMCRAFASFVSKWNSMPETLVSWSSSNCDKIQPRPADMTCDDVVKFVTDCNFGTMRKEYMDENQKLFLHRYYQQYYANRPKELPKYTYYNARTATDYGRHGNWYYPNYYLPTYVSGWLDGRPESMQQLENDYRFAQGGNYPYMRADNVVNIALQQTSLPTCLHDLLYCLRARYNSPYAARYRDQRR